MATVKPSATAASSEVLTGAGGAISETHLCAWQVGAGSWQEDSVSLHVGVSTRMSDSPRDLAAGFP